MSGPDAPEIRHQLERVLGSDLFDASDRSRRFLEYIVGRTIARQSDEIKEYVIGCQVFGRPDDWDPREDAIVRLEARRLRERLREYYATQGRSDPILIDVPKGGYVPSFEKRQREPRLKRRTPRLLWLLAGVAVIAAAGILIRLRLEPAAGPPYVAVLPFRNLSGNPAHDYLVEALADELTVALSRLAGLRVIARNSTVRFRDAQTDLREIGRQLGATALVQGNVQFQDQSLRVSVHVVDAKDGHDIWGQSFDRPVKDAFAVQDEVSRAVALTLETRLSGGRRTAPRTEAASAEARDLYWQGRYLRSQGGTEQVRKAIELYERAIQKDPKWAPPYAALANANAWLGFHDISPKDEVVPKAKAAAAKAIQFDETLTEGHRILAWIAFYHDMNWAAAEAGFRRAIQLNPSAAGARDTFALCLMARGRFDEAISEARAAARLDPLSFMVSNDLGVILYAARRYAEAAEHARKVLVLSPDFYPAHFLLGTVYSAQGRHQQAVAEYEAALQKAGESHPILSRMGYSLVFLGRNDEVSAILTKLLAGEYWIGQAMIHTAAKRNSLALDCLDKSADARQTDILFAAIEPLFDNLRSEPRFQSILRRVGLEGVK